jgi:GH35 family endo-1,4-beta-xylanase
MRTFRSVTLHFSVLVACAAVAWAPQARANRPFTSPDWTSPPGVSDGLAKTGWARGIPVRIGAAVNGDAVVPGTLETSYRQAVLDQFGIVGMENEGLATLAPTQSQFEYIGPGGIEDNHYDWRLFDEVVNFACANNMAVSVAPLFYDAVDALGGAKYTLSYPSSPDGPTVDYWMNVHASRVMARIRHLTGSQCPNIQIYVQVVNEGIYHQENDPTSGAAHLWQRDNCWQGGVCNPPGSTDYTWVANAFSHTQYYDNYWRGQYGGTRPAKLYYNDNGIEDSSTGYGYTVYNKLKTWKSWGWVIDGVGVQGHTSPAYSPTQAALLNTLNAYGAISATFETQLTEVDYILPFSRTDSNQQWYYDSVHWQPDTGVCNAGAAPGSIAFTPPNQPATNDNNYNRHPAELVALFRACRDSNSCTAFMTWGAFDHTDFGNAYGQCQFLGQTPRSGYCYAPYPSSTCSQLSLPQDSLSQYLWNTAVSGTQGYGHPVLLDCLSNGSGGCQNPTPASESSYYRKRAWYWISGADGTLPLSASCTSTYDCLPPGYCSAGICSESRRPGAFCTNNYACASRHCVNYSCQ